MALTRFSVTQPRRQRRSEGRSIMSSPNHEGPALDVLGAAHKLELMNDLLECRYDEAAADTCPDDEGGASIHPLGQYRNRGALHSYPAMRSKLP